MFHTVVQALLSLTNLSIYHLCTIYLHSLGLSTHKERVRKTEVKVCLDLHGVVLIDTENKSWWQFKLILTIDKQIIVRLLKNAVNIQFNFWKSQQKKLIRWILMKLELCVN